MTTYSSEMCIGTKGKSAIAGMLATSHCTSTTTQKSLTTLLYQLTTKAEH